MTTKEEKKKLIEGALFMGNTVKKEELMKIAGCNKEELHELMRDLERDYFDRAIHIIETEDEYKMMVETEINDKVSHLAPHADISPGPLRTLAIIAFKQPVKQSEIVKVQGNRVYDYVKELENRGLIKSSKEGRTKVLETSDEFEDYFGLSPEELKRLKKKKTKEEDGEDNAEEGNDKS